MKDSEEVIEELRNKRKRKGEEKFMRKEIESKLDNAENVSDIKFFNEKGENYAFKRGDRMICKVFTEKLPERGELIFTLDNMTKLKAYSKQTKKNDEGQIKFDIDSLFLDEGNYTLSLILDGQKVVDVLKLKIEGGNKEFGNHMLLEENFGENNFPEGRFYAFGDVKNIIQDFKNGKRTVCLYNVDIEELAVRKNYENGKILGN